MQTKLGVEFEIDFAHILKDHPKCGKPHGHTAKIIVEVTGDVKKGDTYQDNIVMDFHEMKTACWNVIQDLDIRTLMICLIFLHQKILQCGFLII